MAHYHFLISDCGEIGIKMENDISHLLGCRTCNDTKAESLQQIMMKGNPTRKFLEDQKEKYCIHGKTLLKLNL